MRTNKLVLAGFLTLFCSALLFLFLNTGQGQVKPYNDVPVAEFRGKRIESTEEKAIRQQRGRKYTNRVSLEKFEEQGGVFAIPPSHSPREAALPVAKSDLIVIGTVVDAHAYISNDETSVYSEFQITLDEILKDARGVGVKKATGITVERVGGKVLFPSGRILLTGESGRNLPEPKKQYLLFLQWDEFGKDFLIVTGYEIRGNRISPLDGNVEGAPDIYQEYAKYRHASFADTLTELKALIVAEGIK